MVAHRRGTGFAFVARFVLAVFGIGVASAGEQADAWGARARTGWWWRANDTSEAPGATGPATEVAGARERA